MGFNEAPLTRVYMLWVCPRSWDWNAMALVIPYPYTSVPNRSTFGLLHPREISSIVSLSASTLVPRCMTARKSIMAAGFSAGARGYWSIGLGRASVWMYECFGCVL